MIPRLIASLAFGGFLMSASPALAQGRAASNTAEAREGRVAFDQAYAAFQSLDYAAALPLFQRAYQLTRNPAMLYNIGATLEALGRNAEAATAFRRYASMMPDAPNRAEAETRATRLEAAASRVERPAASPAPAITATAASSSPPPPQGPAPPRPAWPFLLVAGGAAIAGAGGFVLGFTPDPGRSHAMTEVEYLRAADAASTQQWVGIALIGVGAAVAIGGVIGIATLPRSWSNRSALRWNVSPLRDGAIIGVGWSGVGL